MGCDAQTFPGITPAKFAALGARAAAAGITIAGNIGQVSRRDVTIAWHYSPAAETLTLWCIDKPFYVPCRAVLSKIQSLMEEA